MKPARCIDFVTNDTDNQLPITTFIHCKNKKDWCNKKQ